MKEIEPMEPMDQIQNAVSRTFDKLNLEYVFQGLVLPPQDLANPSGFLPFFFEQQQALAKLIGIPEQFQPAAMGKVVDDEDACLGKTLEVSSRDAVVPLISYLIDAARMTKRLAKENRVDLSEILNSDRPMFLSVVLDELCHPPTQKPAPVADQEPSTLKPDM